MKAMEKKAVPMPEDLEREWNEVGFAFAYFSAGEPEL